MPRDTTSAADALSVADRGREFFAGLTASWHGFGYMCRHPALWRYGIIPIVLNLLINLLLLLALIGASVSSIAWFHSRFQEMEYGVAWEILAVVGMAILILGVALATWKLLEGVLCGYFYGRLAVAVELQLGMSPDEIQQISFQSQLIDAVRGFVLLLAINGGCLALNCIPVIGSIVGLVVALYFDALILGRNYFDYPLSIRGWDDKAKLDFSRQHRPAVLGLGTVAFLFNFVPIIGAVVLTTATTGGVLLCRRLEDFADT